jgi:hypothetical protein
VRTVFEKHLFTNLWEMGSTENWLEFFFQSYEALEFFLSLKFIFFKEPDKFFKTVRRTGTSDSHKKWELPNSGKYPAPLVTCGTVILSHNRFFPHGSTRTNLCSQLLAWAFSSKEQLFLFYFSIFWWNLTKRKRKINRIYTRKKISKIFSISLSKNG